MVRGLGWIIISDEELAYVRLQGIIFLVMVGLVQLVYQIELCQLVFMLGWSCDKSLKLGQIKNELCWC